MIGGGVNPEILEVLSSIELETRHNLRPPQGQLLGAILDEVVSSSHNGQPISGIISDMRMPVSDGVRRSLFTPNPDDKEHLFSLNRNAIGGRDGGVQLAKVANIAQIPVVIFSGGRDPTAIINSRHMKNMKPAKARVYAKDDYEGIFIGLAKAIIEREKTKESHFAR